MIFSKPKELYPTLVWGTINGPIRCESLDGSELWLPSRPGDFRIDPFEQGGKTYGVSHLQKKAKSFSLLFSPFSYHYGKFWHLEEQASDGTWLPGTEKGFYMRTPGWRWQIPDENSDWSPWIFSKGYVGGHLD